MIDQYTPERMVDRAMIQDAIYRWCRAVDRLDRQGMLAVFHPGAHDSHGPYIGPIEGLVDWVMERHKPIPFSSHFIGNMLIEFASPDLALVESYVRTIQQYPAAAKGQLSQLTGGAQGPADSPMDMFTSSRYLDTFERRDGAWKIARRTVIQDWKQLIEVREQALQPHDGWVIGSRDGNDAMQQERHRLGIR